MKAARRYFWLTALLIISAGCERGMHNMYDQPRYKPLAPSPLFEDDNSSQAPPSGSVIHSSGSQAATSSGRMGTFEHVPAAGPVTPIGMDGRALVSGSTAANAYSNPIPITEEFLQRGQQRYNIYCAPCHSPVGDGDGMIVRRGFPQPPSYHSNRLRNAPESHFYQVITDGYGVMYSYADRIAPRDRWAIVAYIRALQLSQHAAASELTATDINHLEKSSVSIHDSTNVSTHDSTHESAHE